MMFNLVRYNSDNVFLKEMEIPAGRTSWTDQLDGPVGWTSWTDQLDRPAGRSLSLPKALFDLSRLSLFS